MKQADSSSGNVRVSASKSNIDLILSQFNVSKSERVHPFDEDSAIGVSNGMNRVFVLHFSPSTDVNQVIATLRSNMSQFVLNIERATLLHDQVGDDSYGPQRIPC